ncbi:nitrate reductase [Amphritea balenae]|uniref:Nitrate reductase n=1 Tax=Amphritea balenae TaxID=452629 RepID=A0A3P1SVZ3_9GAMM|nr:nitrate reductase [Amphritea balenae]RRD01341.1 nitrate reductase [Amphritea balenae]GGK57942.1 nitrate reductase [Amphritea balenae]
MNASVKPDSCTVSTTCPYCGVGCGVTAKVENNQLIAVSGDKQHPANRGKLCVKGSALHETTSHSGRLLEPQINGQPVSWDQAINKAAQGFNKVIEQYGPDSVAFYLSGQLLTEDYYVANKLMKGFIGSSNVDTNSRLCMSAAVTAHKRAFGADLVPGCYEDLELADLVILVGSNTAWTHPIVYQRIVAAKKKRPQMKIVVVDPRRTATCDIADLHLALKPGSDSYLFTGLLSYLADNNGLDTTYIANHIQGFNAALSAAQEATPNTSEVAKHCNLDPDDLQQFYNWFCNITKAVTLFSQGINQSATGADKGDAIINCHLASGKIGKPGATPFSITGQPNAMGGREVGGLANQIAAHIDFSEPGNSKLVETFWQAPNMSHKEGLKAVDMFNAVKDRKIRAIWIMGTNPVVSMPDSNLIQKALQQCELVVVSDCVEKTDTTMCADILFPATSWGEKNGTVTNSERTISRQKSFLMAPGKSRHDWQIICSMAQAMGFKNGFNFTDPAQIFTEHAALSGFKNEGKRLFNISALSTLSEQQYDHLEPVQWPAVSTTKSSPRLFTDGKFNTLSGKALMVTVRPTLPVNQASAEYPYILNTGRIRDQWHSMTRTAKAIKLLRHIEQPFIEISPSDADHLNIQTNALLEVSNALGHCVAKAKVTAEQQPGSVFMPIHWNNRYAAAARVGNLVPPIRGRVSGQPESKHAPVKINKLNTAWQGILICNQELSDLPCEYWCKIPLKQGYRYELTGTSLPENWQQWISSVVTTSSDTITLSSTGDYRKISFIDNKPELIFFSSTEYLPNANWLCKEFNEEITTPAQRMALLAGKPIDNSDDCGSVICSCFEVGEKTIRQAINKGANSTEKLAEQLKCGSNCGSCLPEIKAMLG